ncbi:MAG: MaoC family dehydratase [Bacteroidetes Order II. Incertae sedis bacterium]|nr:MaoC family dehydratase [Bacteroidetes Order II. bacterium]
MGRYYDELETGEVIRHYVTKTITEGEHFLFCSITLNTQPLHIDAEFARKSTFGRILVDGLFVLSLAVGISVGDLTSGTIVANLGYDSVRHTHPVFHGDTIHVETVVIQKRLSASREGVGIVTFLHKAFNQREEIVLEVKRSAMMLMKPQKKPSV